MIPTAETKKYYWLKLKEDFFHEKEIKKLRRLAGGDTYTVIYLKMLLLALRENGRIYFDGIEDSFADELALQMDEETDNVRMTILYLLKVGLMQEVSESEMFLTQLPECVGTETSKAELMRRKRQRERLSCGNNVTTNSNSVTDLLPSVTERYPEIDTEKEKEKDIEIEKECAAAPAKRARSAKFVPPTVDEVRTYCDERGNGIDAQRFVDYYAAQGWKLSNGVPMHDWKAAVRNWESRDKMKAAEQSVKAEESANRTGYGDGWQYIFDVAEGRVKHDG